MIVGCWDDRRPSGGAANARPLLLLTTRQRDHSSLSVVVGHLQQGQRGRWRWSTPHHCRSSGGRQLLPSFSLRLHGQYDVAPPPANEVSLLSSSPTSCHQHRCACQMLEIMSRAIKRFVDGPMEGHRTQKGHLSYWRITQLRTD